jgi:hypothetical protein
MDNLQTLLNGLEDTHLDYVEARSRVNNDAQGYRDAGIPKTTFYKWGMEEIDRLNGIAQQLKRETAWRAMNVFMKNAERAAEKINKLVDSRNEQVSLAAARDISDRVNGKPTQKTDVTIKGDIVINWDEDAVDND